METIAVVLKQPEQVELSRLALTPPTAQDVVVDVGWSGVSTGTERLLWSGRMPAFPGMGYPLVPGYESVGRVVEAGAETELSCDQLVFVPGAKCFGEVRGLFGASASRLVVPHAIALGNEPPVVWEKNPARVGGAAGYDVLDPEHDERRDYKSIYDVSGDATLLDALIGRIASGGEIVLAGFYSDRMSFAFPPAFMREARLRVAAEWQPPDLVATRQLIESGRLSLDGLITHHFDAKAAPDAYRVAFEDPACLKMVLNWSSLA